MYLQPVNKIIPILVVYPNNTIKNTLISMFVESLCIELSSEYTQHSSIYYDFNL